MKKFILSALIMLIVAGSADAQGKQNKQKKQQTKAANKQFKKQPKQMKGQLYNQLNLSSYQRTQTDRLNQNLATRLQLLKSNNRLSQQQKRNSAASLVQQHQSGFRSLLSPTQSQQYSTLLGSGSLNQFDLGNSGVGSMLGDYGWLISLLGSNLNLDSLLGGNFDLASLLGIFRS